MATPSPTPCKFETPKKSPPPQLKSNPLAKIRCFNCQGFGHLASDCINQEIVTLAKWTSVKEEEIKKEKEVNLAEEEEESLDKVEQKVNKYELLIVRRVLIGLQGVEEVHKEDSLQFKDEKAITHVPFTPFSTSPEKATKESKTFELFSHF